MQYKYPRSSFYITNVTINKLKAVLHGDNIRVKDRVAIVKKSVVIVAQGPVDRAVHFGCVRMVDLQYDAKDAYNM